MRKSKQDWLEVGLETLGRHGVAGLTIERMTSALGVTKGSFYHHFANMSEFEEQLVAFWADQYLTTGTNVPGDPAAALALLDTVMAEGFGPATEPEVAIRAWAQQNDRVRAYVQQVDEIRRRFVLQVFRLQTGDEARAQHMADFLFTILIGCITALPRYTPAQVQELYAEFKRLYGLDHGRHDDSPLPRFF